MKENRRIVAWQGWSLAIPHRWDPIKLEGDHANGYALFADTLHPRLGLRWQTPRKKNFDLEAAVQLAMQNEVGQLAAREAIPFEPADENWISPLLYREPEPPGRDIYSVYSPISDRLLQISYHTRRRENSFAQNLLPSLLDLPIDRAHPWSIFDLNCLIPGGMKLIRQKLNVGDLFLTFADRYTQLTVRQIAVAQLALQRQSLDGWIFDQQKMDSRHYRVGNDCSDITLQASDRSLTGRRSTQRLKRRYSWMRYFPETQNIFALHDMHRDRLLILQSPDDSLLQVIATSIGSIDSDVVSRLQTPG